jgi:hypothetical protein
LAQLSFSSQPQTGQLLPLEQIFLLTSPQKISEAGGGRTDSDMMENMAI